MKVIPETIALQDGQTESWCHVAPFGKYAYNKPTEADPQAKGTQLLDMQALNHLVEEFKRQDAILLVDREHLSIVGDDTSAMGWMEELEVRGDGTNPSDGLYARVKWTDVGLDNIRNRRLRWLSPVWDLDDANRPKSLDSAGLTNRARFRSQLTPVVNKDESHTNKGKDTPEMDWKLVAQALGLSAEATPEQCAAKIAALQDQLTAANAAAKDATDKALTAEGEKIASENETKIANKEAFVKAFVANKEGALACLQAMKGPETRTVVNKDDAQKPSFMVEGAGGKVLNKLEQFREMPEGAAKAKFQADNAAELLDLSRQASKG